MEVDITINKLVFDYDMLLIVGPVFPHEVVGFSGGNKYLFPGIAGQEIIDFFHWLGAVITNPVIIGNKWTPVRKVVDRAAAMLTMPKYAFSMVVKGEELAGMYFGTPETSWSEAADLSQKLHITYKDQPFHTVLSCAPKMYDDIWTGGQVHVQARTGGRRRRQPHHLRAAHHRNLRHPRPYPRRDRLPHPRLLPQAMGQVQQVPLGRGGALHPRQGHRHLRERSARSRA